MKVKNGKARLEKGEVRVGSFFVKRENGHVKVQDINSMVSFRISTDIAVGKWLTAMLDRGAEAEETVKIYASTVWTLLSMVPDDEGIGALLEVFRAAVERHPEYYGVTREDVSDEEDAAIVEDEREKAEFVEQVRRFDEEETGA